MLFLIALHGHIDAGIAKIVGHPHFGHCYQCQPRVFEFITNNLRNLFFQGLGDALRAMHNQRSEVRNPKKAAITTYPLSDLRPLISDLCFSQFRGRDFLDHVILDLVADFDVVKVFQPDAAFKALANLGRVILETAQRSDVAFP